MRLIHGIFLTLHFGCLAFCACGADIKIQDDTIKWNNGDQNLVISLKSPELYFKDANTIGSLTPESVSGDLLSGKPVEIRYAAVKLSSGAQLAIRQFVQYFPKENVIRKWVECKTEGGGPAILNEVIYDRYSSVALLTPLVGAPPQSYPAFFKGFFVGIEYPVASTQADSGQVMIRFRPGEELTGKWYVGRKAVYGIAQAGKEKDVFVKYVSDHRPEPRNFHLNYCSWWSAPMSYTEKDITYLMNEFKEKLFKPYGVSFDSFAMDMGWSDPNTIWKIKKDFSNGFETINNIAASMNSKLGLWISPTNCYSPWAIDVDWAYKEGYETYKQPWGSFRLLCMAGPKYYGAFHDSLLDIANKYKLHQLKVDGYYLDCPDSNHGHQPGIYSSDKIASNGIKTFEALRKAVPGIWIEPTCFPNASPWWMFYVNSTIGSAGDDSPAGRVPCPIYRQSYTSARDFYNLQGTATSLVPIAAQEVLGILHQSREDFTDDAIVTIMRGNAYIALYMDPTFMNERRWKSLAHLIKWAKTNNSIFENTTVLLPGDWKKGNMPIGDAAMPRQVYGYAHGSGNQSLIVLRNPWIQPCEYELTLDGSIGLTKRDGQYDISSIYPQQRVYQKQIGFGKTVKLPMAPYETIVLSISTRAVDNKFPDVKSVIGDKIKIDFNEAKACLVGYEPAPEKIGAGSLDFAAGCNSAVEISAAAKLNLKSSEGRLLILCESNSPDIDPLCKIQLNGKDVEVYAEGTCTGFRATGAPNPENWVFFWVSLSKGPSDVNIELTAKDKNIRVSGWVWAYTQTSDNTGSQLPSPEIMSLDAVKIFDVIDCNKVGGDILKKPRPIAKINGVYLDSMENIGGNFERNLCINKSLMKMQGLRYTRGLGTTTGIINVPLDGKYSRFTATVGVDSSIGMDCLDKTEVMFIVKLDGKDVWKSKPLTVRDQPQLVDADIAGAKTLELQVVQVESKGRRCVNWADWANAALLD